MRAKSKELFHEAISHVVKPGHHMSCLQQHHDAHRRFRSGVICAAEGAG
jgi:hypothetical protein